MLSSYYIIGILLLTTETIIISSYGQHVLYDKDDNCLTNAS